MINPTIEAVLPLRDRDFDRFEILRASLAQFCPDLKTCWVITPDRDFKKLRSKVGDDIYQVLPESSLVPEMLIFPQVPGWYKQQLIKLAVAEIVQSDFFLTLDADVVCVQALKYTDFVKEGRGLCYLHKSDAFPEWYRDAERVLGMKRSGGYHNVTPTVLSREAMLKLHRYLSQLSQQSAPDIRSVFGKPFLALMNLPQLADWRVYLLRNLPWTEYSLYYTFLEATEQFDTYHFPSTQCLYTVEDSLWTKEHLDSWNPEVCFSGERSFYFCVVQSRSGIPPAKIREKVSPYLTLSSR